MAGLLGILGKLFGNKYDKDVKEITPLVDKINEEFSKLSSCLLYTSPSPRDVEESRMPSSA